MQKGYDLYPSEYNTTLSTLLRSDLLVAIRPNCKQTTQSLHFVILNIALYSLLLQSKPCLKLYANYG